LITTNVLARGIDVPEVDLVINFDVPVINDAGYKHPDSANYLHRVGRTGRFGTDGVALSLYSDEIYEGVLEDIETYYNIKIEPINNIQILKEIMDKMRPE
jgi:ATP-dependent RNA helicase DDX19/DBP5